MIIFKDLNEKFVAISSCIKSPDFIWNVDLIRSAWLLRDRIVHRLGIIFTYITLHAKQTEKMRQLFFLMEIFLKRETLDYSNAW